MQARIRELSRAHTRKERSMDKTIWTRKKGWIDVDIGDEISLPVGCIYERRVLENGQVQVRNGHIVGLNLGDVIVTYG